MDNKCHKLFNYNYLNNLQLKYQIKYQNSFSKTIITQKIKDSLNSIMETQLS